MQWFNLRPTFEIVLPISRSLAVQRLNAASLVDGAAPYFLMFGEYGELHLPESELRLWSPHLSFYLAERGGACFVHGRFAPRLNVWSCLWIVYLAMAFTAFFALTLAFSQWMLNTSPWGLWLALTAITVILLLYVVAHIGQQLSADQMHALRGELNLLLEKCQAGEAFSQQQTPPLARL